MDNKQISNIIGKKIQQARRKKRMTQEELAEKCDVSSKYISAVERGISSGAIGLLIKICNVLEVSPNFILSDCINNTNDSITVLDDATLITYMKLNEENKEFIDNAILHLYNMQKKR